MEDKEIWKDIPDCNGDYQASNMGNIRSVDRHIATANGVSYFKKGTILKNSISSDGYERVQIYRKTRLVHRLIAKTFLTKDENRPHVNHKNSIRNDNRLSNIEWCNRNENMKHAYKHGNAVPYWRGKVGARNPSSIRVVQLCMDYGYVRTWNGRSYAAREIGCEGTNISKVCNGKRKSAGGYRWMYLDDYLRFVHL